MNIMEIIGYAYYAAGMIVGMQVFMGSYHSPRDKKRHLIELMAACALCGLGFWLLTAGQ